MRGTGPSPARHDTGQTGSALATGSSGPQRYSWTECHSNIPQGNLPSTAFTGELAHSHALSAVPENLPPEHGEG